MAGIENPTVYVADLRHIQGGVLSNACMPLGIGYMKAYMDRELPAVTSRLFAYPEDLLSAIEQDVPDVLMLTNYVWNENLTRHFAALARDANPEMLIVLGGPNIPLEPERRVEFLEGVPGADVYALGEGDVLATEIVERWIEAGFDRERMFAEGPPSCLFRAPDGSIRANEEKPRQRDLNEIPSPWLTGVMDGFFDGKMIPLIETNRGCPFQCTFCVQGTPYYNAIRHFDEDRVKAEMTYIADRVAAECPGMGALTIADPNYGMYKRDVDIAKHLGTLRKERNWPSLIDASSGKNAPQRIIETIEQASGALTLLHAVQSMDEDVLRNINRSNIRTEAYEDISVHLRSRGLRSVSQTILGLPGETLETHKTALRGLIDSGIDSLQNFQLLLLNGSTMESSETREKFGFKTMYRLSPRGFGAYGEGLAFDTEEIVVETNTLSLDDYLDARLLHLACIVFWNQDWLEDVIAFADRAGVAASTCMDAISEAMCQADGPVREFVEDFRRETEGELFPTRQECIAFYSEPSNFEKLLEGRIGDNLMNKYRAIASFHLWPELCALAMDAILNRSCTRPSSPRPSTCSGMT